jgi:DNA-binding GntR family transcriptional regulator
MLNIQSLSEQVYNYLRDEIHTGGILPDTILNLNEISQRLGISKTPLRDALIKLEMEGFVTIMPRRGVMVNQLTLQDISDFYQIIGALEGEVIKEVFDRLDSVQVSVMRQLNAEMREALRREEFDSYYEINIKFHDIYLKLSDNKRLRPMIMPMKQRLYDFQRHPYVKDWEFRNCHEHDKFIDLIKQRNSLGAAQFMRDVHWSFSTQEEYIREFYRLDASRLEKEK